MTGTDEKLADGLSAALARYGSNQQELGGWLLMNADRILAALSPPASGTVGEAVERGAVAAWCEYMAARNVTSFDWRDASEGTKAEWRAIARAALAAKPDQTALLREARTALFNLGVSHNTFVQMLGDVDTSGPQKGTHRWRLQLGKEAVQCALGNENAAAEALTRIDQALADTGREG